MRKLNKTKSFRPIVLGAKILLAVLFLYVLAYLAFRTITVMDPREYEEEFRHEIEPYERALVVKNRFWLFLFYPVLEIDRDFYKTFVVYKPVE